MPPTPLSLLFLSFFSPLPVHITYWVSGSTNRGASSHMTHDIDVTYFLSFHPVAPLSTWLTLWEEALVNDSVTPRHCKCHCRKIRTGSPRSPFSPSPTGTPDTPFSPCMWTEQITDSDWQQRQAKKTESSESETKACTYFMNRQSETNDFNYSRKKKEAMRLWCAMSSRIMKN